MFETEGRWMMGRFAPRELLESIGSYIHNVAPEREEEVIAAIKGRAEQLADADEDLVVDRVSEGMLSLCAVILAAYEQLLPFFDGDERRTILYLQHVFSAVLKRTYEVMFQTITARENPLDKLDEACRKEAPFYGKAFDIHYERPNPDLFEMRVKRCFFHDFFARHDATPVTTVLCAWDANTLFSIDPAISGLRSERTSLLSLGAGECRFAVRTTDDPLAKHQDALEGQFAQGEDGASAASN
jgi:hypothetical protein